MQWPLVIALNSHHSQWPVIQNLIISKDYFSLRLRIISWLIKSFAFSVPSTFLNTLYQLFMLYAYTSLIIVVLRHHIVETKSGRARWVIDERRQVDFIMNSHFVPRVFDWKTVYRIITHKRVSDSLNHRCFREQHWRSIFISIWCKVHRAEFLKSTGAQPQFHKAKLTAALNRWCNGLLTLRDNLSR